MNDAKQKLNFSSILAMPADMADALFEAGDGDAALLCLYMLRQGGKSSEKQAARALGMSSTQISNAVRTLRHLGLMSGGERTPVPVPKMAEYKPEHISRNAEDQQFQDLVLDIQNKLGRVLTSADLNSLFSIYKDLALPPEVIFLLVNHCKEEHESRYGGEKKIGFAFIEKMAYTWFDSEIVTYEQAEEWIGAQAKRKELISQFQQELGIQNRHLTPTERKYIDGWLGLGYGLEALALAADRTITNTGGLRWKYMDSIVQSWHKKGLYTVEEIDRGDLKASRMEVKKTARPKSDDYSGPSAPTQADLKTLAQLERLRQKMKKGE